jgi:hypothetical protein
MHSWFLLKYYPGDEIKKDEMGKTCGTFGRKEEKYIQGSGG